MTKLYNYNMYLHLENETDASVKINYVLSDNHLSGAKKQMKIIIDENQKQFINLAKHICEIIFDYYVCKKKYSDMKDDLLPIIKKYTNKIIEMFLEDVYDCIDKIVRINKTIIGSMKILEDQGRGSCNNYVTKKYNIGNAYDINSVDNRNYINNNMYKNVSKKLNDICDLFYKKKIIL